MQVSATVATQSAFVEQNSLNADLVLSVVGPVGVCWRVRSSPLSLDSSVVDCDLGDVKKPALPAEIPSASNTRGGSCPEAELKFGVFLELGLSNPV